MNSNMMKLMCGIRLTSWRGVASPFQGLVFRCDSTRGCAPASLAPGFVALPLWGILARGLRAIYRYSNGVWLVDAVPVEFIAFPEP